MLTGVHPKVPHGEGGEGLDGYSGIVGIPPKKIFLYYPGTPL